MSAIEQQTKLNSEWLKLLSRRKATAAAMSLLHQSPPTARSSNGEYNGY